MQFREKLFIILDIPMKKNRIDYENVGLTDESVNCGRRFKIGEYVWMTRVPLRH